MKNPLPNWEVTKDNKKWITSSDLEYMTLVMIYALLRIAWEKNVLVIGLIKDTAASELTENRSSNFKKFS